MTKSTKKPGPNKLAKTGKKAGIELNEKQLDQASGGRVPLNIKITG
jgi:hypothetical protein